MSRIADRVGPRATTFQGGILIMRGNKVLARAVSALAIISICVGPVMAKPRPDNGDTATPIQHVVVIFQENVSFDHYFASYPNAANTDGQQFTAAKGTPSVNGLPR